VLSTLVVLVVCVFFSYSLLRVRNFSSSIIIYLFYIWLFCALAESHRAPFDFAESERELVSGYNTEYIGSLFAFTFLAEYSTLLVSCYVIVLLFFFFSSFRYFVTPLLTLILSMILVLVRVTYCRFRYDILMMRAWKSYLPCRLLLLYTYLLLSLL
jgi:NADH-quinone oxidoreductase subunit H